MAEICCEVLCESYASSSSSSSSSLSSCDPSSRAARRRRMDIRRFKFIPDVATVAPPPPVNGNNKRVKYESGGLFGTSAQNRFSDQYDNPLISDQKISNLSSDPSPVLVSDQCPKFGATAICGWRREMEDAVAIHPSLCRDQTEARLHFFGLYDGHGCSHVAMSCKDRMHQIIKEELENKTSSSIDWKEAMERSYSRMDKEVLKCRNGVSKTTCRCELQMPQCEAVGSTAVVSIVTPDNIIVANCGDSRAVLCRGGKPVPLSTDHKPDLPEELLRIQGAGGRVINWDGTPRVLGVLAMSRAIGDNYLKPYVSSEPEVRITKRTEEDECLIIASDGLWDVVSNDMACNIVRMCLNSQGPVLPQSTTTTSSSSSASDQNEQVLKTVVGGEENPNKGCSDAAMLLTKLALARRSADNVSVVVVDLRKTT